MSPSAYNIALVVASLFFVICLMIPQPQNKIVFLNVGQGDAILIQSGNNQILTDGGPGQAALSELGREMPWFDRNIEVLVLTHPQRDHLEGLIHVLERYSVNLVIFPKAESNSQLQEAWLQEIISRNIPYRFAWAGQQLKLGNIKMQILGPQDSAAARSATKSDLNNASVVTRVELEGIAVLLTGDAEKKVENMLVANTSLGLLDVDILKVGHHGSNSSTHQNLLSATSPKAAVISVGADNQFSHPHQAVLTRLGDIPIWRTDLDGAVRLIKMNNKWLLSNR